MLNIGDKVWVVDFVTDDKNVEACPHCGAVWIMTHKKARVSQVEISNIEIFKSCGEIRHRYKGVSKSGRSISFVDSEMASKPIFLSEEEAREHARRSKNEAVWQLDSGMSKRLNV